MNTSISDVLKKAVEAHRKGEIERADAYYTAILNIQPKHPDANHNLGVLAVGLGKTTEGIRHFKIAIDSNPKHPQYWASLIQAYINQGLVNRANYYLKKAKQRNVKHDSFDKFDSVIKELLDEYASTDG